MDFRNPMTMLWAGWAMANHSTKGEFMSKSLKPFIVVGSVVAVLCATVVGQAGEAKKTPWKITGQLEEACTCDAACPCWFGSKPTKMTCGGGQGLFIERGRYGGTSVKGVAVGG